MLKGAFRGFTLRWLQAITDTLWTPGFAVFGLFGSHAVGLALPNSSIDVVMDFPGDPGLSLNVARQRLGDLAQLLSNDDWVMEVTPILAAKMPYLKLTLGINQDAPPIRMNLTCHTGGNEGHTGILDIAFQNQLLEAFPYLRRVVIECKHLLEVYHLNDPYVGGLSSYSVLMLAASVQNKEWYQKSMQMWSQYTAPGDNTTPAILAFLDYYGNVFDVQTMSVFLDNHDSEELREARMDAEHYARANALLFIADPKGSPHNVAPTSYNFPTVQQLFRDTLEHNVGQQLGQVDNMYQQSNF